MSKNNINRLLALFFCAGIITTLAGQDAGQGPKIQYLFPEFGEGVLVMKNSESQKSIMNFNVVTEKLVFVRDGKYYDLMNPEMVDTVYINNRKFVPAGRAFFEVLYKGDLTLFIQNKGDLVDKGVPVGYGATSQTSKSTYLRNISRSDGIYNLQLPDAYTVKPSSVYWIRKDGNMLDFTTQKEFLALFPEKSNEIKNYIKESRLKFSKNEDLIKIVKFCWYK